MLGRKQSSTNAAWITTMKDIAAIVPREHLDRLVNRTIDDIRKTTKGKTVAYCWSGGKDSQVLQGICSLAGIKDCVMATTDKELEFPAFLEWVGKNKPPNIEVINTGQDMEFLVRHIGWLFPQNGAVSVKWDHVIQHRGQDQYFWKHGLDMMLFGRRKADGNFVGKSNVYKTTKGAVRYNPIADWRHEDVLAFVHHFNMPLPPFYSWEKGFVCGTHCWPSRQHTGSIQNGWKEIWGIDRSIVVMASNHIESAKQFLGGINHA
jgi:3'-phosphoadenosine 5'-phosphosulfate sulfotransferase (PAPS reductase)/FAD synthetase